MTNEGLSFSVFRILRNNLFDDNGNPLRFELPPKGNTQDDPLDTYICGILKSKMSSEDIIITKASGPLINPDLVVSKKGLKLTGVNQILDTKLVIGVEVKKLERKNNKISRKTGVDYNSTPPCGKIIIKDSKRNTLIIRSYYLFVCLEKDNSKYYISALVLCDGNLLNEDFLLYSSIVGERKKTIEIGTYKDGLNRDRPMLVFANPLAIKELDKFATLITEDKNAEKESPDLELVYTLIRTIDKEEKKFYCYRLKKDVSPSWDDKILKDPFPIPKREEKTQKRGAFILPDS